MTGSGVTGSGVAGSGVTVHGGTADTAGRRGMPVPGSMMVL